MYCVSQQITQEPVDKLIPYISNSRTHSDAQVAQIAASIKEFGFINPILITQSHGIIAGHGRLLAARKLDMLTVPCIALGHLTDTQVKAYVIADNKLALNAEWDIPTLLAEINQLEDEGFDLGLTGFSDDEIESLTPETIPPVGLTDDDDVPEVTAEPITKTGDVWLLGVYYQCEKCHKEYSFEEGGKLNECLC